MERAEELADEVATGDAGAIGELVELAIQHRTDAELYLDHVYLVPRTALRELVTDRAADAQVLVESMAAALMGKDWGTRDFNASNGPLEFLGDIARVAATTGQAGLLEDAAGALFEAEARWQRFAQRKRTRGWLESLETRAAETVARALRRVPEAARWYMEEGWEPRRASAPIREAFAAARLDTDHEEP